MSSMFNKDHTPGPWVKSGQSEAGRYITIKASGGRTVARVLWNTEREADLGIETDDADANLIAAAPHLLTALEKIASIRLAFPDSTDQLKAAMLDVSLIARAAIATAKQQLVPQSSEIAANG